MKHIEIEDFQDFIKGATEDRHRIYLKYLDRWEDSIDAKFQSMRHLLTKEEVQSDAVMAIHSMFCELQEEVDHESKIMNTPSVFLKQLSSKTRQNAQENSLMPDTYKAEFKKTVSKTSKKDIYKGYETSSPRVSEDKLTNVEFREAPDKERVEYLCGLIDVIAPDVDSVVHKDMIDRFVHGKTIREISEEPRNEVMSDRGVDKRLKKYILKIGLKIKQEDGNE